MKTETRAARVKRLARELGAPALDVSRFRLGPRAAIERLRQLGYTDDQITRAFETRMERAHASGTPWPTLRAWLIADDAPARAPEPERLSAEDVGEASVLDVVLEIGLDRGFAADDPRRTFQPEIADWIACARAEGLTDARLRDMFREALHEAVAQGHTPRAVFARWFLNADPHDPELRAREGRHEGAR